MRERDYVVGGGGERERERPRIASDYQSQGHQTCRESEIFFCFEQDPTLSQGLSHETRLITGMTSTSKTDRVPTHQLQSSLLTSTQQYLQVHKPCDSTTTLCV